MQYTPHLAFSDGLKTRCFGHTNKDLYAYAANNPVYYTDPDGNDIKEITVYNISAGFLIAGRISIGVAIDSNCDMAVFMKFEVGIGCGVTAADESLLNTLGISKLKKISDLYDSLSNLKDSINILDIDNYIPEDTGKGNLNDLPIEDYLANKIPVSCKREIINDWDTCPVEACVVIKFQKKIIKGEIWSVFLLFQMLLS